MLLFSGMAMAEREALGEAQEAQRSIFSDIAPSVVFLTHDDGEGSGFFVSSQGDILTNAHVVDDHDQVEVVLHDGRRQRGHVIERNDSYDLAMVSVDIDETPPVDLASMDRVEVGDWVGAVGHGAGAIWTYTTGMISNIYPFDGERPLFQTQIPVNPGNSGGPVFNYRSEVIGLVSFGIREAQNLNFAIPVEQAVSRLEQLAERCDCLIIEAPQDVPVFVDDVMVGSGPRVVMMAEEQKYEINAVIEGRRVTEIVQWPQQRTVELGEEE